MDVARAVGRDDDDRRLRRAERAELGHRDRVVGEDLEQERLELVVGPVDLVDEEHRRGDGAERLRLVADRSEQRALDEEALRVELVLDDLLAGGLDRAQVEQLAGVVPLVDGLPGVDALVALQPHQLAAGPAREHLGHLGLADARLAFEQQRALEPQGEEHRGGEPLVGEVLVLGERGADVVDRLHHHPAYREGTAGLPGDTRASARAIMGRCRRPPPPPRGSSIMGVTGAGKSTVGRAARRRARCAVRRRRRSPRPSLDREDASRRAARRRRSRAVVAADQRRAPQHIPTAWSWPHPR